MQPEVTTFDEFTARQTARETGEEFAGSNARTCVQSAYTSKPRMHKRRPVEPKESSLADLLMQAIHLAGTHRGRLSQAESVREQTLLEVLTAAIRRAQ